MGHFYTNFDVFVPRFSVMTNKIGTVFARGFMGSEKFISARERPLFNGSARPVLVSVSPWGILGFMMGYLGKWGPF